jgi:hypothetical protein
MSLGKRIGGSGDITPLIKFDARSGVLYRCDRTRAADGEWYTSQENITGNFVAVFDMENVQVGWIAFSSGGPPNFVMSPVGADIGNPPGDQHKQGFRLRLKLAKGSGGGVRDLHRPRPRPGKRSISCTPSLRRNAASILANCRR